MKPLKTLVVAFSMYSAIPVPHLEWDADNMRYAMLAFPAIGVVSGLVVWGWAALAAALGLPFSVVAVGVVLVPVIVSGGIHLDGFCDTADAIASHAPRERKLEIMKDSHAGAFAIIAVCCYFIAYYGFACAVSLAPAAILCLGVLYVLVRAASGLAVASFPCAKDSGLVHAFADAAAKRTVAVGESVIIAVCAVVLVTCAGMLGLAVVVAVALMFAIYHVVAMRLFGGITGDVAGWFLQWAELLGVMAIVVVQALL